MTFKVWVYSLALCLFSHPTFLGLSFGLLLAVVERCWFGIVLHKFVVFCVFSRILCIASPTRARLECREKTIYADFHYS